MVVKMKIIDISGGWRYQTDYDDAGCAGQYYKKEFTSGGFMLPGSACENGVGQKQQYYDEMTKEAVRAPRERFEYIAPLWLQRKVDIPQDFTGKHIRLFLERVNIASELWIDGEKAGRQIIELSAPHIYDVTDKLTAGEHTLTLRIDNRNLLNIGTMASGYSIDTQGYWNGIIGRMELQCEDIFRLENIQVYPKENGIDVRLVAVSDVYKPTQRRDAQITLSVSTPDGKRLPEKHFLRKLFTSRQVEYFTYENFIHENFIHEVKEAGEEDGQGGIQYWDEFTPNLYTLHVRYVCGDTTDDKSVSFGMRTIETHGKQILLNHKPISLRGTIDCAIYPLTGYPPTDIHTWRKNFETIKSYGLNHVRFHAWCPPEAAFCAADELGLYLSVEMPLWLNRDVCPLEVGEDSEHRAYYTQEAMTISKTYGNHPSFIMFSNGNENMGDFELLEDIIIQMKAYDTRRLYTLTTNFDHSVLPCEDYLCAFEAGGHKVRIQDIHDIIAQGTTYTYSEAVRDVPVPVISFEMGQYCVYPDVDVIEKYTGNMLPVNFDVVKKQMMKKGVYHRLHDYIQASGNLAVKLYKEDIEAALRTKDFGGFELLSLCDYTGQSTATIGILDAFFDSKGIVESGQFREFCNDVVPLWKSKRLLQNTEILEAELDLYDYGRVRIEKPVFEVEILIDGEVFYQTETADRNISVPLHSIHKPSRLLVEVSVESYVNHRDIYVFPAGADSGDADAGSGCAVGDSVEADIGNGNVSADIGNSSGRGSLSVVSRAEDIQNIIHTGGRAIVTADCLKNPIAGSFIPVFWSPVHFPSQKPCGAIIDETHPVFMDFPTEKYPDYQWKNLLDNSINMDISSFGKDFRPIVEIVPNFVDNTPASPLFEAKVGRADILFCGFDLEAKDLEMQKLETKDLAARQLKASIRRYAESEFFHPANRIEENLFMDLWRFL
ncbi:MAG: hypothetical protein NC231_02535 [Bacillus sp. (in: Bacteria)]|nr:hypothetical protein [Bacillus sp. (in: firmicutes)]MCM1425536.1 hypothetical protein [Eubacterium sp.]